MRVLQFPVPNLMFVSLFLSPLKLLRTDLNDDRLERMSKIIFNDFLRS